MTTATATLNSTTLADVAHAIAYVTTPGPAGIPATLARRLELDGMLSESMRATPGRTVLVNLPSGRRTIRSWTRAAEPYVRAALDTIKEAG